MVEPNPHGSAAINLSSPKDILAAREGVASVGDVVRGTVLLVEHDGPVRAYLEQQLANDGFEVLAADRGVQALDLAEEVKPDLVLLDAVLPDWEEAEVEVVVKLTAEESSQWNGFTTLSLFAPIPVRP